MCSHTTVYVSGAAGDDADIVALKLGSEGGGGGAGVGGVT
jgi:hypothetical protein